MINLSLKTISTFSSSVKSELGDLPGLNELKEQFTEKLLSLIEEISKEELQKAKLSANKVLSEKELKLLCNKFANDEIMKSVLGNITPNVLSCLKFLPALIESYKSQSRLISRLAIGMGKEHLLGRRETFLVIMLSSGAQVSTNILIDKGGTFVINKISQKMLPKVIHSLTKGFISSGLSSTFSGLVPGLGAAAVGMFNRYSMKKIGQQAIAILSKDIQFSQEENLVIKAIDTDSISDSLSQQITFEKLKVLINLMKVDGDKNGKEMEHICVLIENSDLKDNQSLQLYKSLSSPDLFSINYTVLMKAEQLEMFVFDLIAFTSFDTSISLQEISYISRLLGKLNLEPIDHYIIY